MRTKMTGMVRTGMTGRLRIGIDGRFVQEYATIPLKHESFIRQRVLCHVFYYF